MRPDQPGLNKVHSASSWLNRSKNTFRALYAWLTFRYDLSPEVQTFTTEWHNHHQMEFILDIARFCRWLFPFAGLVLLSLRSNPHFKFQLLTWLMLSIICWAVTLSSRLVINYIKQILSLASILILVGATAMARSYFSGPFDVESAIIVTQVFMASLLFNIRIFPFQSPLVIPWSAMHVVAGVYAFGANPLLKLPDLIAVLSVITAISVGLFYAWVYNLQHEAVLEHTARQVIIEEEQSKINAMRSDIARAGSVADQLDIAKDTIIRDNYLVSTFQRRYSALGGDWGSYHTFKDGRTAVLVADATGKGVQAALVIHALKAMWATAIEGDMFDALSWLDGVNKVFYQLGHKQDHTLTLGLLMLEGTSMIYYSAGHLPVFLVKKSGQGASEVELISGRGRPIGMTPELEIEPVTSSVTLSEVEALMLGTDGVFERGHRTRKREILRLKIDLEAGGEVALDQIPRRDDQLVVWLRPTG